MFLSDKLNLNSEREYTDEGFLKVPARIARTGIQEYSALEMGLTDVDPKKIIRVFRPETEVFAKESLATFASKPVTDDHPPELVNAKNSKNYIVGMVSPNVVRDGDFVKTELTIVDEAAIKKIESGKVELSNGYESDIDWTPGTTDSGLSYDAIQTNIKGNHVAIVDKARAGAMCKVADSKLKNEGGNTMAKVGIDGVDFEVSDQAAQAIGKLKDELAAMKKKEDEAAEEMKKKEDEAAEALNEAKKTEDSFKAKLDDAQSKIPTAEQLDALVSERQELIDSVLKLAPQIEWKGKDSATLKKEVVALHCKNVQLDSVSSDYIDARFDILLESEPKNILDEALKSAVGSEVNDQKSEPAHIAARKKMIEDARNAWKKEAK